MKLGTVSFTIEYTVDLDNTDMVDHAKQALLTDLDTLYMNNELECCLSVQEDAAKCVRDIPEFLKDE